MDSPQTPTPEITQSQIDSAVQAYSISRHLPLSEHLRAILVAALAVSKARTTQLETENAQLRTLLHEWSILYHEPIPDSLTLATRDVLGGE